jgi:hypothetical protein
MTKDYCCPKCNKDLRFGDDTQGGIGAIIQRTSRDELIYDEGGKFDEVSNSEPYPNIQDDQEITEVYCVNCGTKLDLNEADIFDQLPKKIELA